MINIVVPIYNEDESVLSWLQQVVSYLSDGDRLVVVDASNTPVIEGFSTHALFQQDRVFYLKSDKGRALQMNAGAEFLLSYSETNAVTHTVTNAEPSLLWFLHSDSGLSSVHLRYLSRLNPDTKWGRFDVQFTPELDISADTFSLSIIPKLMNLRSRLSQVMTGDQGIFIRSDVFQQLKGYAEIPLMEDIEISKRLRKLGKADCDGPVLKTSARRWQKNGCLRTVLLMWKLRLMYWLGVSPALLVKKYYGE
ncbi:MAG: glycosyltransferase family 2 protein [Oleispira sp.]|nr:glycosyltransferase family 2 protein [Oleispira sp.]MBL4880535.1 glycosyltransferase family 2 protein [Oleispira sp.]